VTVAEPPTTSGAFTVDLEEADGRLVLRLAGDLDSDAAPELHRVVDELPDPSDTVLDLSGLTFVDSSGLGCLFRLQQRVADAGGILEAHGASPQVRGAMQLVQLNRVMALLD
jgi:anti-anti-sigma factor